MPTAEDNGVPQTELMPDNTITEAEADAQFYGYAGHAAIAPLAHAAPIAHVAPVAHVAFGPGPGTALAIALAFAQACA